MTDRNPPCAALSAPVAAETGPGGDSEPPGAHWVPYARYRPGSESLDLDLLRAWATREGAQVVDEVADRAGGPATSPHGCGRSTARRRREVLATAGNMLAAGEKFTCRAAAARRRMRRERGVGNTAADGEA
ncbi:hypothetical protein F5972_08760 [Microbispora cellulosiformans]|uniref:Uncharacterized protein n=1 Tax=Microbispora cellulosiformans TaxID=2614688 RepID=A0A5J5K6G2_9ACTN|nr:hypothetical protein [Microbispora cellulosiformans]KAA9379730.1 hypothetical protein F5972_08760 [Microbispora cellulosiformans]